jgi:hypothetical protein
MKIDLYGDGIGSVSLVSSVGTDKTVVPILPEYLSGRITTKN